jgi:DNA-binding PadR family transcriptional regulator
MNTSGIMQLIKKLRPETLKWLRHKGYLERVTEDGTKVLRLTDSGSEYFVNILKKS